MLTGPAADADRLAGQFSAVQVKRAGAQAHLLVSDGGPDRAVPPGWESHPVGLEELVLAYLRPAGGGTRPAGGGTSSAAVPGSRTELTEVSQVSVLTLPAQPVQGAAPRCGPCRGGG